MKERKIILKLNRGDIKAVPVDRLFCSSSVDTISRVYGSRFKIRFSYHGVINVKVGISREGYSFQWIAEEKFQSVSVDDAEMSMDLSSIETGTLEITFFALSDAIIYQWFSVPDRIEGTMDHGRVLYDFIFPSLDLCCEEPLYLKFSDGMSYYSHEDKTVHLYDRSCADFLTYFNSFSSMKWTEYTNVRNVSLYLDIRGNAEVNVVGQYGSERFVIDRYIVTAAERGVYVLPVTGIEGNMILGVTVRNIPPGDLNLLIDDDFVESLEDPYRKGASADDMAGRSENTVPSADPDAAVSFTASQTEDRQRNSRSHRSASAGGTTNYGAKDRHVRYTADNDPDVITRDYRIFKDNTKILLEADGVEVGRVRHGRLRRSRDCTALPSFIPSSGLSSTSALVRRQVSAHDPLPDFSRSSGYSTGKTAVTSSTEIYGGGWLTDDPETQNVHLGITITTFKREKEVKAAVSRLVRDISSHPKYAESIDIAVVDNGNTLTQDDVKGALLITNRNLGGTGGFTRGLIHYQETGRHTHCLFMDDDASCEAGAIFRSMSFQRHVTDHRVALSGAMLFENIKFMQWENGAWFDGGCHSIKRDFDLRDPVKLYENEEDVDKPIYGAWWFFFFPLDEAKNYSLPFFVRGDDIDFSYANDFRVVSLNGVSCWQQDFKTKESAMTAYLFLRSHIVHHMTVPTLKCSYKIMKKILWGHFREYNNSYFYGTAACVNLAMKHVMMGPQFWEDNIVPVEVLRQIKELSQCEKPVSYTEEELRSLGLELADCNLKTKIFPVLIRKLSLYGHLLPDFMIRKTPKAKLPKWMTPRKERTYMRSQITVLDELNRTKTVLKRSPCTYFKNLFTFMFLSFKLRIILPSLRRKYMKAQSVQRTREFWKKQFDNGAGADKKQ